MSRAASQAAPPCGTKTGGSSQAMTTRRRPEAAISSEQDSGPAQGHLLSVVLQARLA
jgi:hypothetical protein